MSRDQSVLTTPTPIFFNQLLVSMNLYQDVKNKTFSSFCSRDMVDLKIWQCDWLRAFWQISQEPNISQVWGLCHNTANNVIFFINHIQNKLITKCFNKPPKPYC